MRRPSSALPVFILRASQLADGYEGIFTPALRQLIPGLTSKFALYMASNSQVLSDFQPGPEDLINGLKEVVPIMLRVAFDLGNIHSRSGYDNGLFTEATWRAPVDRFLAGVLALMEGDHIWT